MAFQPFSTAPPTERDLRHTRSLEKVAACMEHGASCALHPHTQTKPQANSSATLSLLSMAACSGQLALHARRVHMGIRP